MGATIGIGASLIGAGAQMFGASKAASAQKKAAVAAANAQLSMFNDTARFLKPYRDLGDSAAGYVKNNLMDLTKPITMDQAALEQTPGYQFTLKQGLKSTQNSAAARGLGSSGAAMKGASEYTTGLADKTYLDQFNVANTNATNTWNRLMGAAGLGENAAAQTGQFGMQAANGISNGLMAAGNAQAAGYNAMGQTANNALSNLGGYFLFKNMYGNSGSSGLGATPGTGGLY